MFIENKRINSKSITWTLRCPTKQDAIELSKLILQIDGETENGYKLFSRLFILFNN
jgi:two-component SAPR family response regulator